MNGGIVEPVCVAATAVVAMVVLTRFLMFLVEKESQ